MDLGLKTMGSKSHARLLKKLSVPPVSMVQMGKEKFLNEECR